jgi:hypothetical protein
MATRKRASSRSRLLKRAVKAGRKALRSAEKRVPPDLRRQIERSVEDGQKTVHAAIKRVQSQLDRTARQADLDRVLKRLEGLSKRSRRLPVPRPRVQPLRRHERERLASLPRENPHPASLPRALRPPAEQRRARSRPRAVPPPSDRPRRRRWSARCRRHQRLPSQAQFRSGSTRMTPRPRFSKAIRRQGLRPGGRLLGGVDPTSISLR